MVIAVIILSILLFLALTFIVVLGIDEGWHRDEWFTTFLFIFLSPAWLIAKISITIKGKIDERKIKLKRKKLEIKAEVEPNE